MNHLNANGKAMFLRLAAEILYEIEDDVRPYNGGTQRRKDSITECIERLELEAQRLHPIGKYAQPQESNESLAFRKLIGSWPGDETDDEIRDALG